MISNARLIQLHQPWQNCEHLSIIAINDNNLENVPGRIFEACRNVMTFSLMRSQTLEIDQFTFVEMNYVRNIFIVGNLIRTLHHDIFVPCPHLSWTYLVGNVSFVRVDHEGSFR